MVGSKILVSVTVAGILLVAAVGYGADANGVKELFAQAQSYLNEEKELAAADIYREIAAGDIGGDDGLSAQEKLILLYVRYEKPSKAKQAYEELMANFSSNEKLVGALENELISAFRDSGDYETSLEMYEYVIARGAAEEKMLGISSGIVKCYLGLGDDANATAEVEGMLSRYANDERLPRTVYDLAHECRQQKRWGKAREFFEYFVANWPGQEKAMEAQRYVVKASIKLGDDEAAKAGITKLIADYGGNAGIGYELSELADDYAGDGNRAKAVELYGEVVERWPGSKWAVDAQKRLARMWITAGDYEKADAAAAKLKAVFGGRAGAAAAVEDVGDGYQLADSSAKAYALYKWVVENLPDDDRAIWCQMKAATAQIRMQDLEKSEEELGNLLSGFAGHEELAATIHEVVEEYRNAGLYEEGRGLFAYLLENWDETPETLLEFQVGIALSSIWMGQESEAEEAIETLCVDFNDNPKLGKALFQIGEAYYEKGVRSGLKSPEAPILFGKAMVLWDKFIKEFPPTLATADAYYLSGICYRRRGNYEKAIDCFREVVANWPTYHYVCRAQLRIAKCYEKLKESGTLSEAEADVMIVEAYSAVVEDFPDCGVKDVALHKLGRIYYSRGEHDLGKEYYKSLLEIVKPGDFRLDEIQGVLSEGGEK